MDITSTDIWLEAARLIGIGAVAYLTLIWIAMVVWVYRDISERTDDVLARSVSVAVVAVFFAPGLLAYLALRPRETTTEALSRRLELEAFAAEIGDAPQCPQCRRASSDEFLVCPYCRTSLRAPCGDCGRLLAGEWSACPYCASPRRAQEPAPRRAPAPIPSVAPVPATGPALAPMPTRAPAPRAAAIQLHR